MSECVVRMEMPQGCEDCRVRDILLCCSLKERKYAGSSPVRPNWCPIICQLPEGHGRLIDAEKLKAKKYHSDITHENAVAVAEIDWAKTIVTAEVESPSPKPTDPVPKPTDPVPIRDVYYVMTECDAKTGTVKYELRERREK